MNAQYSVSEQFEELAARASCGRKDLYAVYLYLASPKMTHDALHKFLLKNPGSLADAYAYANRSGMYDAADIIQRWRGRLM